MIKIGKILKAQGIKGEVKVSCLLDDSAMLADVKHMYINDKPFTVKQFRSDGKFFYVRFAEVADRNAAENLRDWTLFCHKSQLPLPEQRYFVEDVVGCNVVLSDGTIVGSVAQVLQYGAADVFVCNGSKQVSFPFLKDLVVSVDIANRRIVVDKQRFAEVALYED